MTRLARDAYGTPLCLRENREAISALVPAHIEDAKAMAKAAIAAGDSPSFFTAEWIAQTARVLAKDAYRKERDRELLERANVSEGEIVRIVGASAAPTGLSSSIKPVPVLPLRASIPCVFQPKKGMTNADRRF